MDDVFLGEIRYVAFSFAPQGWALCQGQVLPIAQNTALFSLLGITYGGNGTSTFALPDIQGRILVGQGQGTGLSAYDLGEQGGEASVSLTIGQMAAHGHAVSATSVNGSQTNPTAGVFAKPNVVRCGNLYSATANAAAAASTIVAAGSSQPHENRAPGLGLTGIIALQGAYPARP